MTHWNLSWQDSRLRTTWASLKFCIWLSSRARVAWATGLSLGNISAIVRGNTNMEMGKWLTWKMEIGEGDNIIMGSYI